MKVDVQAMGVALRGTYPFVTDWWKKEVSDIRIHTDESLWKRVCWAARWLNPWLTDRMLKVKADIPVLWRFGMFWFSFTDSKYRSVDTTLDGDNYFTWQEAAEYIVLVQPLVGEVIGQFLIDEPEHPHAIKIAEAVQEAIDNAGV